jgi:hypothetical protein
MAEMRSLWIGLVFLALSATAAVAQQMTVRLLDGRNGHPLKNQVVDLWFSDRAGGAPLQATTGQDGTVAVKLPRDANVFVAAGEGVADCREGNTPGKTFIDSTVYAVSAVLNTGVVANNSCGDATQQVVPGTFTFFLRPKHVWEKMRE